jgi:DNA invertase Pin-like site-specific DNA recombinase
MPLIGYARTSTLDQLAGLDAQARDLKALGCTKVFTEQASSVGSRPVLVAALDYLREGDVLVVTKLDRLARSITDLWSIVEILDRKGVALRIEAMGIDTTTPTGKLMLSVLGGVAQFEREVMLERQREGIAKAKTEGKYTGRKPTARAKAEEVQTLHGAGKSMGQIAKELGISKASVSRILAPKEVA